MSTARFYTQIAGGGTFTDANGVRYNRAYDVTYNPAAEGTSATITVTQVTGSSGLDVLRYSTAATADAVNATATAGTDYVAANDVLLAFTGTPPTATFTIPINADNVNEGDEFFFITFRDTDGNTQSIRLTISQTITNVSDTTPPAAPTIDLDAASDSGTSSTDNLTNDDTPTLSGTAEAGSTVEIFDGVTSLGTVLANGSGQWSFTTGDLADGVHNLTAKAKDAAGNVSPASAVLAVTVDTAAPAAPTIDLDAASDSGTSSTDNLTSDDTPTLGGTAEAGSTVEIFDGVTSLGTVLADGSGQWSFTTGDLADGVHNLTAKAKDAAGNVSPASGVLAVTVDTAAPAAPTIDLDPGSDSGTSSTDNLTNDDTPTLSGTAEAGSKVAVYDGVTLLGEVTADASGQWTFTTGDLADGVHSLTAKATDAAGNVSPASGVLAVTVDTQIATPTLDLDAASDTGSSNTDNVTQDDTPTLSGTAEAGSTVEIFDGVTLLATVTASPTGEWSFTTGDLADGPHSLTAKATDAAGNEATSAPLVITVDTSTATPTLDLVDGSDTGTSNSDNLTKDDTPTLSGTAEAGATVEIFDGVTLLGAVTASPTGEWSYTTGDLADGPHSLTAKATDAAGNEATSAPLVITVDTVTPTPTLDLADGSDTGTSDSDNLTKDDTPTLSGTAEANAKVEIFDGVTLLGTVTASPTGEWSFTTGDLADGPHSLTAKATDTAGNEATSAALEITVDTVTPTPTLDLDAASDTGASSTDNVTKDDTPTLSGTAEANAKVEIFDGVTLLGTVTASPTGQWSFTTGDLADGPHSLTVTATDAAGNEATSAALEITVDTQIATPTIDLDAASDTGASNSDNLTKDDTPTLSGTAEANAKVEIFDGVTLLGTVTASPTGQWSFTTGDLADGPHSLTVTATDAAGNEATSAPLVITVDTSTATPTLDLDAASDTGSSNTDNVTQDDTPTLSGTAEAGAKVEVFDGVTLLGTVTASPTGQWSYTTGDLADGVHSLTAKATDAAGNEATSAVLEVTVDTQIATPTIDLDATSDTGASNTDNLTKDDTPTLSGAAEAGSTVEIFDGVTLLGTATANASGQWTFTTGDLADGPHSLTVTATDAAGNEATSAALEITVDTVTPTPTLDLDAASDTGASSTDNVTKDDTPTLSGTAEAGAKVEIFDGVTLLGTVTASPTGQWSYTTGDLADGVHSLTAKATDAAGNEATSAPLVITVDTSTPTPTIDLDAASDTGASNTDNVTKDDTPTLNGTAEAGSTVQVFDGVTSLGTVTANASGEWTFTTGDLADGVHSLTVKGADAAGNEATSAALEVTVDTQIATPTIDLVDASDTGASNTDNVTKDDTPTLSGAAEAGAKVEVFDGVTSLGTVIANASGQWSFTTGDLADGVHSLTVKATDTAGNVSNASGVLAVTVDTALNATNDAVTVNEDAISENLYASLLANDGETGLVVKEVTAIAGAMPTGTGNNLLNFPSGSQLVTFEASDSDLDVLEPGQTQTAKFTYKVEDLAGNTSVQTVTVTVQGMVEAIGSGIFKGTNNNDTLQGSAAVDKLHALNGNDVVIGGGGADILLGGAGNDIFHFDWASEFGDQLFDFQNGTATSAADKVRFNVGVGQIEIGDNDTVVEAGEIIFYVDRQYSQAEIAGLAQNDAQGHLMIARMSDTGSATIWYDAPGAGAPAMVLEFVNMKSAKDFADMSFQDFLFV